MSKVSLNDLARHLGLGKSTVQRALAGTALVKASTRERVVAAARELGYEYDFYFAALASRRDLRRTGKVLIHYFFGSPDGRGINLYDEFAQHGGDYGIEVELVDPRKFPSMESIPRILCERGSQGFLVGLCDPSLHRPLRAIASRVPIICCQRHPGLPFHTVRFSVAGGMRMCWDRLWQAGYRRIGCAVLRHNPLYLDDEDRLGTALALMENHLSPSDRIPPLLSPIEDLGEYGSWVLEHEPEAIIGFHPELQPLSFDRHGHPIPFVALHARPHPSVAHVAGTRSCHDVLAREALRQMSSLIRHGEAGAPRLVFHHVLEAVWQEGHGLLPPSGSTTA